jgi:Holliday junction resolvasome RuvABC endonuclease subunit
MENRVSGGLSRSQILALDVATVTGYYSLHGSGTWNFSESLARNGRKQHKAFRDTLIGFITLYGIRKIVAEDVSVNNHFTDVKKLSEFRGILLEVCDELDLPQPEFVNVAALKKFATGNGRATKPEMMAACVNHYRFNPRSHDEADAFLLFHYYCRKWRIT